MIHLHETAPSKELRAASRLRQLLVEAYPRVDTCSELDIHIIPGFQCYGEDPQDIDILLIMFDFREHQRFFKLDDGLRVESLCLTIEAKELRPDQLWFEGNRCFGRYHGISHDVSSQSEGQKYSLLSYATHNGIRRKDCPRVRNLIWLLNAARLQKTSKKIMHQFC